MNSRRPSAKDTRRFFEPWTQDAPPPDVNVWVWLWWQRTPRLLSSHEHDTPHILMERYEFDGDGEREKDYCKVRFAEVVVTDVLEIRRSRTDLEDKDCSFIVLTSEFQVLLYSRWIFNRADFVMITTLISFEDL